MPETSGKDIWNPLMNVTLGSRVTKDGTFQLSALQRPTADCSYSGLIQQTAGRSAMTGQSSYFSSESMNRGSLGVSGSYGFSLVEQISASVQGYLGQSQVDDVREVRVDYHSILLGGIEYLDLESMKSGATDLVKILTPRLQDDLFNIFDAFAKLGKKSAPELLLKWLQARDDFFKSAGQGFVIGVQWGAIATISMTIRDTASASAWQFGGRADFTYASEVASLAVQATYDGSRASRTNEVSASWSSYFFGGAIKDQLAAWENDFKDKSLTQLNSMSVLSAPNIPQASALALQSPPDFKLPKPDPELEKKLADLRNLKEIGQLKELNIQAAYQNRLKTDPELKFEDFQNEIKKPANTEKLETLIAQIKTNNVNVPKEYFTSPAPGPSARAAALAESTLASPNDGGAYVPLGVFVADWADVFPWLSTAALNDVASVQDAEVMIRYRTMIQDFDALRRIYSIADAGKLSTDELNFGQIANSFSNRLVSLADLKLDLKSSPAEKLDDSMRRAVAGLLPHAKHIYAVWCDLAFLRDCELGMALAQFNIHAPQGFCKTPTTDGGPWNGLTGFPMKAVEFDPEKQDGFSVFSDAQKCLPIILPNGTLRIMTPTSDATVGWFVGGDDGLGDGKTPRALFADNAQLAQFALSDLTVFTADKESRRLANLSGWYGLPIPFTAAAGLQGWKGQSLSTNVATFTTLQGQLDHILTGLKATTAWSFGGGRWTDVTDWTPQTPYDLTSIPVQYFGLIPEANNVFSQPTNLPKA